MQTPENQKETLLLRRLCANLMRDIALKQWNLILFVVISHIAWETHYVMLWGMWYPV